MRKKDKPFTKIITDPKLIKWYEENGYIEDGKRKHKKMEVADGTFRFDTYQKLSPIEKHVIDSAIDGALNQYALEYNRLPNADGRDERRRLSSMLRSGIDGAKALNDTRTAEALQKSLNCLPAIVVTKKEILKEARNYMQDSCRILGKSLFKEVSNQMLIHFKDEAPKIKIPTDDIRYLPLIK